MKAMHIWGPLVVVVSVVTVVLVLNGRPAGDAVFGESPVCDAVFRDFLGHGVDDATTLRWAMEVAAQERGLCDQDFGDFYFGTTCITGTVALDHTVALPSGVKLVGVDGARLLIRTPVFALKSDNGARDVWVDSLTFDGTEQDGLAGVWNFS